MILGVNKILAKVARAAVMLVLLLGARGLAPAITLEAYKAKVESGREAAVQLETSLRDEQINNANLRAFAQQIRNDFPVSERIEWEGGAVETNSEWLLEKVRALGSESDSKTRLLPIVEIREYLSSVSFKLQELEQTVAAARTKDQDKQKLAEILRREEYQKPQEKQESLVQRWLRAAFEWLESIFPKPTGAQQGSSGVGLVAFVLRLLLYGGLIALLAFLVYKIVPLLFPKLKRTPKRKKEKGRVILGEQLGEDVTALDLFSEAERLAREGNLRGAIRKGYIALLCELSDRKIIGLAGNKTNRDYLRDIRSRRDLHPKMKTATEIFERHWYGSQASGEQDWARFREEYNEAVRSV